MRVSILIPAHDRVAYTAACLEALLPDLDDDVEVLLVDDASCDATPVLAGWPRVRYERLEERSGFARAINRGADLARGEFLVLLNNDTIPQPGWLEALCAAAREPEVGVVGARLIYPGTHLIQHAGMAFGADRLPYHIYRHHDADRPYVRRRRPFACVTGACMLVPRELYIELGGLDEGFENGFEDVDLCLRSRARGLRCLYEPDAVLLHYEGLTAGRFDRVTANLRRFRRKWNDTIIQDDVEILRADGFRSRAVRPATPELAAVQVAAVAEGAGDQAGAVADSDVLFFEPDRSWMTLSPVETATPDVAPVDTATPDEALLDAAPENESPPMLAGLPPALVGADIPTRIDAARPRRQARDLSILWLGPLHAWTSAAAHGRELCTELTRQGASLRVLPPAAAPSWLDGGGDPALLQSLEQTPLRSGYTVLLDSRCAPQALASAPARAWEEAGRRCLRLGEFMAPPGLCPAPGLAPADTLWVPTEFHRRLVSAEMPLSCTIETVPVGVDTRIFHPHQPPLFIAGAHGFVCLAVFPWRAERGWDVLLRAYLAEFAPGEDVTLVIDTGAAETVVTDELLEAALELLPELADPDAETADVVILREPLSPSDYPGLLTAADVLVAPDRAATDGRLFGEALAAGLPVITTAWGATRDWLGDPVGAGIAAEEAADGWSAEPSLEDLRRRLRQASARAGWSLERRRHARSLAETDWTIEQEAAAIIDRLRA